jgi:zinc/manganese transport system substrate-binding protein
MNPLHLHSCIPVVLTALALAHPRPAPPERAGKPLEVVTTLGVLADLSREVGGDRVHVESLADPREDPHYVQPRPTLMQRARDADLFVELGLQLELWAGKVVEGSGNPRIQAGQPGRVVAAAGIPTLELPRELSREWGDVHPYGNPHLWLDPLNAKDIAANIARGLEGVDPEHKAEYEERLESLRKRIDVALFGEALVAEVGGKQLSRRAREGKLSSWLEGKGLADKLGGWLKRAAPLQGRPIVTFHKSQIYFAERFGLKIPIEIEEKPGIQPSARHRDAVVELIGKQGVKTILQEVFYDRGAADYLSQKTGAHVVIIPIDVGEEVGVKTYFDLIDNEISKLLDAEGASSGSK